MNVVFALVLKLSTHRNDFSANESVGMDGSVLDDGSLEDWRTFNALIRFISWKFT